MYHDQVLTPAKTLFEYDAINITMGLPFLRVSRTMDQTSKCLEKISLTHLVLLKL